MVSSKAEFVSRDDTAAAQALLSRTASGGAMDAASMMGSPLGSATRPAAQPRSSNRSRTSSFLSNALLRQRRKSVSNTQIDDWGRQVGGSEGLGSIYDSSMGARERSQVLRSVTQLAKQSTDDLTGAAAEAFSGEAMPSLSQIPLSFANLHHSSIETPPSYEEDKQLKMRRRSEGSIISNINHAGSPLSPSRPSLHGDQLSLYSSMGAKPSSATSASASSTSCNSSSVSASPAPHQPLPSQSSGFQPRRSSDQFSTAARHVFRSSRSFLGLHFGISEDQREPAETTIDGPYDGDMCASAVGDQSNNDNHLHRQHNSALTGGDVGQDGKSDVTSCPAENRSTKTVVTADRGDSSDTQAKGIASNADFASEKAQAEEEQLATLSNAVAHDATIAAVQGRKAAVESVRANIGQRGDAQRKSQSGSLSEIRMVGAIGKANPTQPSACLSDCRACLAGDLAAPSFHGFPPSNDQQPQHSTLLTLCHDVFSAASAPMAAATAAAASAIQPAPAQGAEVPASVSRPITISSAAASASPLWSQSGTAFAPCNAVHTGQAPSAEPVPVSEESLTRPRYNSLPQTYHSQPHSELPSPFSCQQEAVRQKQPSKSQSPTVLSPLLPAVTKNGNGSVPSFSTPDSSSVVATTAVRSCLAASHYFDAGATPVGIAPTLSSTSSFSINDALRLSSSSLSPSPLSDNTSTVPTAATSPCHSSSKLTSLVHSSDLPASGLGTDAATSPDSKTPFGSQYALTLATGPLSDQRTAKQVHPWSISGAAEPVCGTLTPAFIVADHTSTPLFTPPSSPGDCPTSSSASLIHESAPRSGVLAPAAAQQTATSLPSPPASSACGSTSASNSRRGSRSDSAASRLNPLSPRSSLTASSPPTAQQAAPDTATGSTPTNTRVSFDLRRLPLFGASSTIAKMSSHVPRASFAGLGTGQSPHTVQTNSSRHASSPSANSSSKFFSRISLPRSSRRGSAADSSPLSSPDSKPRSRFASFGRISRGGSQPNQLNDGHGLRTSMQPWASASTDVLGMAPGQGPARNSLALAREEATRPRKSLHLPRTNLIDLDASDASDATASSSTAAHALDNRALAPIAAVPIKAEKSVSPSQHSARRPSLNFLRRASATSTNSNTDMANGERRSSFARNLMNRSWSRGSKTEQQQDSGKTDATNRSEAEPPVFRNGIFDLQVPASTGGLAHPGLASTVNWHATSPAHAPNQVDIAPNDVDPMAIAIPPYPASITVNGTASNPKSVSNLASEVVGERRLSQGIDQEQEAAETSDTLADTPVPSSASPSQATAATSQNAAATRQRPTRSSHALSHLPRLDSMRAIPSASTFAANDDASFASASRARSESIATGETSEEEQEVSEEEDETDITGNTSDYHDLEEGESDDETDEDNSPVASRLMSASAMVTTGSSSGLNRNRPTESLVLPPAPTFISNDSSSEAGGSTSTEVPVSQGESSQSVGRDAWTSFSSSGFTPFETPTPSFGGANSLFAGPTPRARQEVSESSYFTARPGTSNSNRASTAGTMSGDAPPPSPSIISRSRAPSSASMRTLRTPGAPSMGSGPVPNRSMPVPVGALPPLTLRRQISTASGASNAVANRSHSPAGAPGSSRPSTSGTLTPLQAPGGERITSREPSMDRPASERPASRQDLGQDSKVTPGVKLSGKPLMGLDGFSTTTTRPNFYQQKSKSLVDLLGPTSRRLEIDTSLPTRPIINEPAGLEALRTPTTPRAPLEAPAYSKKDGLAPIETGLTTPSSIASPGGMSLGRRRSMFEMRAEPPEYSIIHHRPEGPQIILPREEEGREKLPTYCCGVHIEGYLPRKMEFSAPGVQAKDRSWRRQYFVLHGTSLRVYKNDLSVERHALNGSWGEMKGVHVHLEPMNEDGSHGSGSGGIGLGAAAREAISHTPLGAHRHEGSKQKETSTQFDAKNGLIRNYTLQSAESGLAADYLKRRHVVRVRAEGEQFLLQTRSDRHVVDWIEALQAATNVSMDLEKRAMPKFITLPRRRRRRRRQVDGTANNAEEQEARDLAEAQRRSIAEAGGRAAEGTRDGVDSTTRASMSQRPSMSMEDEMNPSAAFERMLREDQEQGGRQSAAVM